jgi:mono/diheme cytochrome c family protein
LRAGFRSFFSVVAIAVVSAFVQTAVPVAAQNSKFHNAPASAAQATNPYSGNAQAAAAGKKLYAQSCASCHDNNLQGMGPAPTLVSSSMQAAKPGELFWFVTDGDLNKGMPGWSQLSKQQRWQIVTFLEMKNSGK